MLAHTPFEPCPHCGSTSLRHSVSVVKDVEVSEEGGVKSSDTRGDGEIIEAYCEECGQKTWEI